MVYNNTMYQNSMSIDDSNDKYSLLNVQDPMVLYIKGKNTINYRTVVYRVLILLF